LALNIDSIARIAETVDLDSLYRSPMSAFEAGVGFQIEDPAYALTISERS